jgi:hypothetical protein
VISTVKDFQPFLNDSGCFVMKHLPSDREFNLTEHSLRQLGYIAGTGFNYPSDLYFNRKDELDSTTLVVCIANGLRKIKPDRKLLWRIRNNNTLRAILTNQYAIIDNQWVLETLEKLIPGGRLSHWRGDSDTIYGNILIPDTIRQESDSEYGGMFSVSNCEIGIRKLSTHPSVFRAICMNGCIWDRKSGVAYEKVHKGKINYTILYDRIKKNLENQIPLLSNGIDRLMDTRSMAFGDVATEQLYAQLTNDFNLTKKQVLNSMFNFHAFEFYNKNLFGLINSITRAGQKLTNDEWVFMDELGGRLMVWDSKCWDNFTSRAKLLDSKAVNAILGV